MADLAHAGPSAVAVDPAAAALVPSSTARRYRALPVAFDGDDLVLAIAEASNVLAIDDLTLITGRRCRPLVVDADWLATVLDALGGDSEFTLVDDAPVAEELEPDPGELDGDPEGSPVVRLVHQVLQQAIEAGASDVHFAPVDGELRGQFRIDGVLVRAVTVPKAMVAPVLSRIKLMAGLDIAERRLPQDGRMSLRVGGAPVDVRVVTLPLVEAESVVLRILDRRAGVRALSDLRMPPAVRAPFENALRRTHGAVLVCGPTGSGKSTTLYAALAHLDDGSRSVVTIEDPVEQRLPGVKQMPVNARAGVTFAAGLRAVLRADPDVIMVGEVRDRDTAKIAVEASLTGHLVLSTLHTNDAPTAISRLLDMGVEPFLVASALRCVVAQRLVRRLCEHCRTPVVHDVEDLRRVGLEFDEPMAAHAAVGCGRCAGTGYRGRFAVHEVLVPDERIAALVLQRASARELGTAARATGWRPLVHEALACCAEGLTSIDEVARVARA